MPSIAMTLAFIRKSHRFRSNRATTRSGIPVVTADKRNVVDFLEEFFFPGQAPVAAISGGGVKEMGEQTLSVNLSWSVTKGSANIQQITVDGQSITPSGGNQSGTKTGTLVQDTNKTFSISVSDLAGKQASAQTQITWRFPNFYGASALDLDSFKGQLAANYPGGISGLSKVLATSKATNQTYDCSGGKYIYVLYPASYGEPAEVKNGSFDFSSWKTEVINIKDISGGTRSYRLFYCWDYQNARQLQYFGEGVNINIQS
jgi:hypothetical protein